MISFFSSYQKTRMMYYLLWIKDEQHWCFLGIRGQVLLLRPVINILWFQVDMILRKGVRWPWNIQSDAFIFYYILLSCFYHQLNRQKLSGISHLSINRMLSYTLLCFCFNMEISHQVTYRLEYLIIYSRPYQQKNLEISVHNGQG